MKKTAILSLAAAMTLGNVFSQESTPPPALAILTQTLEKSDNPAVQLNLLRGINAALNGKRDVPAPAGWQALYGKLKASPNDDVRQQAQTLAAIFGGGDAMTELRSVLVDRNAPMDARRSALDSLVNAKNVESIPPLIGLLNEAGPLRGPALRGLSNFDDASIPAAIMLAYGALSSEEKRDALGTMVARVPWAKMLLGAIDRKSVAKSELSAPLARQLQDFKDAEIDAWLAKNWGAMRASSEDKQKEIAKYKTFLTPESFASADPYRGRALYAQACQVCHSIHGAGGKIGPELTGAYKDIDYLLQNILDPNAVIGLDYQQTVVRMKDGQMLSGVVTNQDESSVTLKTLAGSMPVQRADVAELTVSPVSMMPEGLLAALSDDEVRDLFAYLGQHGQNPMLATPTNINDFFNGADLGRWYRSSEKWKLADGEIVGQGAGKRPEFLVSDLAADNFRFSAQIKLTGKDAAAEIAVRGHERDGRFEGASLSFGGNPPVNLWKYIGTAAPERLPGKAIVPVGEWVNCEVVASSDRLRISLNEKLAFDVTGTPGGNRTVFAFHLLGEGAELRIKQPKLELLPK
jgi:putative heme-binding domain-containing protein